MALQPSQPLPGILDLNNTRVSVFPEVEEFLGMLYGFVDHFLLREIHPAQQILEARV